MNNEDTAPHFEENKLPSVPWRDLECALQLNNTAIYSTPTDNDTEFLVRTLLGFGERDGTSLSGNVAVIQAGMKNIPHGFLFHTEFVITDAEGNSRQRFGILFGEKQDFEDTVRIQSHFVLLGDVDVRADGEKYLKPIKCYCGAVHEGEFRILEVETEQDFKTAVVLASYELGVMVNQGVLDISQGQSWLQQSFYESTNPDAIVDSAYKRITNQTSEGFKFAQPTTPRSAAVYHDAPMTLQ